MQLFACFCALLCLVVDTSTKSVTSTYDETDIGDYPDSLHWNADDNLAAEDTKSANNKCPPEWGEYEGKCEKCDCGKDSNCTFSKMWLIGKTKTCLCKVGYEDKKEVCTGTCKENPCLNGGICRTKKGDIKCDCKNDFYGELCENHGKNPCKPNPCLNNGKCQVSNGEATCLCQDPFTGPNCTIDRCKPNPCQNNGKCQVSKGKLTCLCQDPFTGTNCTIDRCNPNPCQNSGKCQVSNGEVTCLCQDPFTGPNCTIDRCNPNPCQNDGECKVTKGELRCFCKYPYTGRDCTIEMKPITTSSTTLETPSSTQNSTILSTHHLTSSPFDHSLNFTVGKKSTTIFTTLIPTTGVDPCTDNPCQNGGVCVVLGNKPKCLCKKPYLGNLCEAGPCDWNPCKNGGVCKVENETFKCYCKNDGQSAGELCEYKTKIGTYVITLDAASMFIAIVLIFVFCVICLRHRTIRSS